MRMISDMNTNELSECLCKIAGPAEKLFSDGAVRSALDELTKYVKDKVTGEQYFSLFSTILYPVLTGSQHKAHTYAVLAALDGVTSEEIETRNGVEVMGDIFRVFVIDKDLMNIFRPSCEVRGK